MATIPPGRLNDVTNAADHITLVADNFEVLSEELFKVTPTYQNGAPNTVIGPPTSGERVLGELWKDSLGAWWRCTAAGTPGTWQQVLPAAVAADPASGTIPTGCLMLNVTQGTVKRHAGGFVWEIQIGGSASASSKIGFWGAAPVVQPSGANQAAVTLENTEDEIGGLAISDPPNVERTSGAAVRLHRLVRNCSICPIHTPPGLTVASHRNCNPAATLTTILNAAQHRRGRRPGSLTRQIETTAVMRRAMAPSHTRRTPCKKTQSHGTASACHNAAKTTVAAQAPINPTDRRLRWSIASTKIVQAHAATKDAIKKGKNGFTVGWESAG